MKKSNLSSEQKQGLLVIRWVFVFLISFYLMALLASCSPVERTIPSFAIITSDTVHIDKRTIFYHLKNGNIVHVDNGNEILLVRLSIDSVLNKGNGLRYHFYEDDSIIEFKRENRTVTFVKL